MLVEQELLVRVPTVVGMVVAVLVGITTAKVLAVACQTFVLAQPLLLSPVAVVAKVVGLVVPVVPVED
jgi:hypothetical protein